ncbi:MAG: helix-turn-helix domain-containing protein, partial [Bacilli bacterium]
MKDVSRRQALSGFLKTQRGKLQPHSVGLPVGGRRRTPGLRREEVAFLAGVSTTWYTWLEQGRDISVSAQVLDCIANALRLNEDERKYLFILATVSPLTLFDGNNVTVIGGVAVTSIRHAFERPSV